MLDWCKIIETLIFNVNGNSLRDPLIIGTFKEQAPGPSNIQKVDNTIHWI